MTSGQQIRDFINVELVIENLLKGCTRRFEKRLYSCKKYRKKNEINRLCQIRMEKIRGKRCLDSRRYTN